MSGKVSGLQKNISEWEGEWPPKEYKKGPPTIKFKSDIVS